MCIRHTSIYARGHEIIILVAHDSALGNPSLCRFLEEQRFDVDQVCGMYDWEEEH
jgi:hypothetical protein